MKRKENSVISTSTKPFKCQIVNCDNQFAVESGLVTHHGLLVFIQAKYHPEYEYSKIKGYIFIIKKPTNRSIHYLYRCQVVGCNKLVVPNTLLKHGTVTYHYSS